MCLGIPGEVLETCPSDFGIVTGKVRFGGVVREVNLSYTPEVAPGDWVVVHVGFAISVLDEEEARRTLQYLEELGDLMEGAAPGEAG